MKFNKITALLFLVLTTHCFYAQELLFTDASSIPEARSAIGSANDGENIYIANGFGHTSSYKSEIYKYNTTTDSWSLLTGSSISKRFASAAVVNNKLYVFNGIVPSLVLNNQVEVIDLTTGAITLTTNHPNPSSAAGVSVWNNKIYAFGGNRGSGIYSNNLYEFDPVTEVWTALTDMPIAAETRGEIIDGKLYLFGGYNGSVSNRIDIYTIATDTWETGLTMPIGVSAHNTAIIGPRIYLLGDFSDLTSTSYFDTTDNSFHTLTNNMNPRRHCGAEGINNQLYVLGGNTAGSISSALNSVQVSDITLSVNEYEKSNIIVYPNPTTSLLYFNTSFDSISVYDISGRLIESHKGNITSINVKHLLKGMYFLKASKEGQQHKIKFITK